MIKSNVPFSLGEGVRIGGSVKVIRAETFSIRLFFQTLAENSDFGAHSMGQFHTHVAEPTQADDRYPLAGASVPVAQR